MEWRVLFTTFGTVLAGWACAASPPLQVDSAPGEPGLGLSWAAQSNHVYQVWSSRDLRLWVPVASPLVPGAGASMLSTNLAPGVVAPDATGFLRVEEVATGLVTNRTLRFDGVDRSYDAYIPETFVDAPVVMLFHGHNRTSDSLLGLEGGPAPYRVWLELAEAEGFLLLVPDGVVSEDGSEKGWNDCRADAAGNSTADDVGYVSALLDATMARYRVDPARVYACGTSNGGHFAIRLAEEMPDRLTAFAAITASMAADSQCPTNDVPVSALFMNGTADPILPYTGGSMGSNRGTVWSTADTVAHWVTRNGAAPTPLVEPLPDGPLSDSSTVTRYTYANPGNGTEVVLVKVVGGGHTDPSLRERYSPLVLALTGLGAQNGDIEMAEEAWNFFRDLARP